jgi:hypothetical protein
MAAAKEKPLALGARIVVRDAEWLIRRVDRISTGGQQLTCTGISELVKDKNAIFITDIEPKIEILDPTKTSYAFTVFSDQDLDGFEKVISNITMEEDRVPNLLKN